MGNDKRNAPMYGVSDHYIGDKAARYFQYLLDISEGTVKTNLWIWRPYIFETDDVLDFGCGVGSLLSNIDCQSKVGIEINPVSRRYVQENLKLRVFEDTSQLQEAQFSKIIVNHVLEHVPDPYHVLLELRKVIRKDGLLLILLPLEDWRASGQKTFDPEDVNQHLYTWTPRLLGNLLWQAGFEPLELRIITRTFPGRFTVAFSRILPDSLFSLISWAVAWSRNKRQLFAVARQRSGE